MSVGNGLTFEWDAEKAKKNLKKNGVSFEEATTVFGDPHSLTIPDPAHSTHEERFAIIGLSYRLKTLVISHVERNHRIRIINARQATRQERKTYEEGK